MFFFILFCSVLLLHHSFTLLSFALNINFLVIHSNIVSLCDLFYNLIAQKHYPEHQHQYQPHAWIVSPLLCVVCVRNVVFIFYTVTVAQLSGTQQRTPIIQFVFWVYFYWFFYFVFGLVLVFLAWCSLSPGTSETHKTTKYNSSQFILISYNNYKHTCCCAPKYPTHGKRVKFRKY